MRPISYFFVGLLALILSASWTAGSLAADYNARFQKELSARVLRHVVQSGTLLPESEGYREGQRRAKTRGAVHVGPRDEPDHQSVVSLLAGPL